MNQGTTNQIKTQETMFWIKTQIRELREADAKEAARLLPWSSRQVSWSRC